MSERSHILADPEIVESAVKPFADMSDAEFAAFDQEFVAALEAGDDSAVRASLEAGVPVYYAEEETPASAVIKEYPDGQRELVTFENGTEIFLRIL